jgi:mannose-6-phosphate isomerase-like protein (cupin superfamily)
MNRMVIINRDEAEIIRTPHGSELRPLVDRTTSKITQCSLAEEVLPPGCSVSPHHHLEMEEIYYIVSGSGLMKVADDEKQVVPGDAIYVPRGSRHTLINNGTEDIRLLVTCGPAFFYEDQIPVP